MVIEMLRRWWPWLLVVAVGAALLWALNSAYNSGESAGRAAVLADWQRAQLAYDQAVRQREDSYATARTVATAQREEELKDASATIARVHADRERLRTALRDAIGRIPAENGGTAGGAASTGAVLANVCSRAGEVAAELAAYADRERIARQECQRAWPR